MNGLELLVDWSVIALAAATGFVLEGIKRGIDLAWKERKNAKWFCDFLMPFVVAPAVGFALGALIPFRPEALVERAGDTPWLAYGIWGALVGAIGSEWGYRRLKKLWPKKSAK